MTAGAGGVPLGFKVLQGRSRSGVILGDPSRDTLTVEARQSGHHFKDAVVQEGRYGSAWKLASDEGLHLKGTNLAPSPLAIFNAGLQSELAGRVARLARVRGLVWKQMSAGVSTQYSLTGSFALGTGRGKAEAVGAHIALDCGARDQELCDLIAAAVAQSPLFDLVMRPLDNSFALYCNGRRRHTAALPASAGAAPIDPFLKYKRAPEPVEKGNAASEILASTGRTTAKSSVSAAPPAVAGRSWIAVNGEGQLDPESGLYRGTVAVDREGSSIFSFTGDETAADRAPSGLAFASTAIAFCYMTQLSRYIEAMELAIRGVRLVQTSPFTITERGSGEAGPCDTHLFMQGEAQEEDFERLQLVAAHTCYLHQTMQAATPLKVTVSNGGRMLG